MSTEPRGDPGFVDLERELTCSICTELLYQPLTLLDCLHTFCGSCLKEWFYTQASSRRSSSSTPRFTCPSCRAAVRETRPNATVTTLLDMVLTANPERARSAEEKEEIAQRYKAGDHVLPTVGSSEENDGASDDDDRRLLEEVRDLSLQESRTWARGSSHRGQTSRTHRAENTDADSGREEGRSRRRREDRHVQQSSGRLVAGVEDASERTRQVEHQSSLRSLLSLPDTETMEEEILRQILEGGLLNDIDLDNLGPAQEEELSERIADAYRRRHMRRPRSRSQQRQGTSETPQGSTRPRAGSQPVQRQQTAAPVPRELARNPPVSRPYLLEPLVSREGPSGHRRRLSDQGAARRRTSPVPVNAASSSDIALRPAVRSSSDIIADRPRPSQSGRARATEPTTPQPQPRRATESDQGRQNMSTSGARERDSRQHAPSRPLRNSSTSVASPEIPNISRPGRSEQNTTTPSDCNSLAPVVNGPAGQRSRPSSSRSTASQHRSTFYIEPSISCDRCGKPNIQYDLHKKCLQCKDGKYHLCLRCYRSGRGCLQWTGFGPSAKANFERMLASSNSQPPSREIAHILQFFKYRRPADTAHRSTSEGRERTSDDPARRLQTGLFCDICQTPANDCFWKCNQCNEGDWGFCNKCVNQGRCCTHPLLPICRIVPEGRSNLPTSTTTSGDAPTEPSTTASPDNETFKILSFSTNCDICTYPIPASATRFHCLECNEGDYDTCANCYLKLVPTGKISKENGHNGWRRCIKGHRMVVVGFEDHEEGQRRVIVRDLVGGRALKDEHLRHSSSSVPAPTQATTANGCAVPSPELGSGDWSWKDGPERRKKASRARTFLITNSDRGNNGSGSETPTPTTPQTPFFRRFPPDGGVGLIVHALWSWYPEDEVKDELMFPRGAEITEVENINDDWFWGCYAGLTGLFPGAHVSVVGEIA